MEEDYIERLKRDFPEHNFEAEPDGERAWKLKVDGRLFKIRWSHEFDYDLEEFHGLDAKEELYKLIVMELKYELAALEKVKEKI